MKPHPDVLDPPTERTPIVVVANRLPVRRDATVEGGWSVSPGGMVAALAPALHDRHATWVGWTGGVDDHAEPFDCDGVRLVAVPLAAHEVSAYYEGFANATLWPLYHDTIEVPQFHRSWWNAYRQVNERFAEHTAATAAPGATVWIHDYHLHLVPALLRARRPDLRIGFFLHIPVPPQELFFRIPWRTQLIEGLLGADLIGFQTPGGVANFRRIARRLVGARPVGNALFHDGRTITCDDFPVGIDAHAIGALARSHECERTAAELRHELGVERQVLLGVDRLDYTKGIPVRLRAYGELLADGLIDPRRAVMVQIAQPTRSDTPGYTEVRSEVDRLVGQINGDFATMTSLAVKYLHQGQSLAEIVALYRVADVMLVTPFRDGMNLVAKEFVAANADRAALLVLSEFAGAAGQLRGAQLVNPFDIANVKDAILAALATPSDQRRRTMRRLARSVHQQDAAWWSRTFLQELERAR